jgi:hypothetical protein
MEPQIFLGTWKKDSSTSGPTTRLSRPYESGTLVLNKDGTFYYRWAADDVMGDKYGTFIITDSINGLKILKLLSPANSNFYYTILEADNNRLKTTHKSSYKVGDSTITFDMIDIFKKIAVAE